jgi:hypothetical protein
MPFLRKIMGFGIICVISAVAFAWAYDERTLIGGKDGSMIFAVPNRADK